jgi:hypothetical protein
MSMSREVSEPLAPVVAAELSTKCGNRDIERHTYTSIRSDAVTLSVEGITMSYEMQISLTASKEGFRGRLVEQERSHYIFVSRLILSGWPCRSSSG